MEINKPGSFSVSKSDLAVVLEFRRPAKANAYDDEVLFALRDALSAALTDNSVRVVVFTGAGERHFCAGADLGGVGTRRTLDVLDMPSARLFDAIAAFPKPTIAAVNGAAAGGGVELALACDLRIAALHAFFTLPETGLGLIPAAGGVTRLSRVVGEGRAREMVLTGRRVDAETALSWGLVNEVVAADALLPRALEWARSLADMDADALALAKEVMDGTRGDRVRAALARLSQALLTARTDRS